MSYHESSPVKQNRIATLAEVVGAVRDAELTARRKQEITSALNTVARALGKPPERVSAQPRRLAELLASVAPLAIGSLLTAGQTFVA